MQNTQPFLSQLSVYPIKSSRGIHLSSSWVDEYGLSFDRRFVITDHSGQFITARTEPSLCLIQTSLTPQGLKVIAPDMPVLNVNYADFSSRYIEVEVWGNKINAQHCRQNIDHWFSQYLNKPCKLMFFGDDSQRPINQSKQETAFADGYPLLLISQASLDELNTRLKNTISMQQFRPNIVVSGCNAFAEDSWKHIRIGEVEFEVTKPCSRCIFTTINPETAHKHNQQEPLKTLKKYRQMVNGDVMFGQNLIQLNKGQINRSDPVTVLSTQSPPHFLLKPEPLNRTKQKLEVTSFPKKEAKNANKKASKLMSKEIPSKVKIDYTTWNKEIAGNSKVTILEQGEEAGLVLPHSCRGGMCGRCKLKLEEGDVRVLAEDGLTEEDKNNGYILACSCIPTSDIKVSKPPRKIVNRA